MRNILMIIFLIISIGCGGGGSSGSGDKKESKPKPPVFEVEDHQLYTISHECLADCTYDIDCAKANCLEPLYEDDLLCRGDIILPEVYGYNENANTTDFWYVIDFTDGPWDPSPPGPTEFTGGKHFQGFPSQAYYITDPDTYRMEIWIGDADGNKTKPYYIFLDPQECY